MADAPVVFGPYVLLKSLGAGGAGDVFLARPVDPKRGVPSPVVVKRLHGQLASDGDFLRRFEHEARLAVAVDSPHLVRAYDVGRVGDTLYIAMEYVAGWTLARIISDLRNAGAHASLSSAADIVCGALLGLEALHSATAATTNQALGIVHRDVAPKNIMVGEDGVTRLIDLGLGKSNLQDWRTGTGVVMGSPGYMAPEQVTGGPIDPRIDVYAMGVVLWELLTLERYFKRAPVPLMLRAQAKPVFRPPSSLRSEVPSELDEICRRALAPSPSARFGSARALIDALREAVPEREEAEPVATIVGEMLWGELGAAKTEVTALISMPPTEPVEVSEAMIVFAERDGVRPSTLVRRAETLPAGGPVAESAWLGVRPASETRTAAGVAPLGPPPNGPSSARAPAVIDPASAYGGFTPSPQALGTPLSTPAVYAPARRGGVPIGVVLLLMGITLLAGIGVGVVILDRRTSIPALAPLSAEPPSAPAVRPVQRPTAQGVDEAPTIPASAAKIAPRPPRRVSPAPSAAETTVPAAPPPARDRLTSLLERAQELKRREMPGSEREREIIKLIGRLSREAASSELAPDRVAAFEKTLSGLERSAP